METKFNYLDTKGKTQKANNVQVSTGNSQYAKNYLFDFSLLEKYISDSTILQEIEKQCMSDCSVSNKMTFVSKQADIFTCFDYYSGNLYFKPYMVYSNSKNKRVYTIMQLVKIEYLTFNERHCIYDEFKATKEINDHIGVDNESEDVIIE